MRVGVFQFRCLNVSLILKKNLLTCVVGWPAEAVENKNSKIVSSRLIFENNVM